MAKKASGRIGNLGSWAHPPKGKAPKPVAAAKVTAPPAIKVVKAPK